MTTNPKGYKPKVKNPKYPLTVQEQRKLIDKAEGKERAILIFFLSTGAHPSVLSDVKFSLDLKKSDNYYSWARPKTNAEVGGSFSKAMTKQVRTILLSKKVYGRDPTRFWQIIEKLGRDVGIEGVCPLQLRHTHFANRARLGHDIFSIVHGSGTSLNTIAKYYTFGLNESKKLSEDDRHFLEWLMEA